MKKAILRMGTISLLFVTSLFAGANAGTDHEGVSGELVQLQGSASTLENGGEFFRFVWRQTAGSPTVRLSNSRLTSPTFFAPDVDETTVLTFRLVTKERFNCKKKNRRCQVFRSKDFVSITIQPKENEAIIDPDSDFIVHKGFTYLPVTSPSTGRVWLDRNLGAKNVCNGTNETSCYGGLYQWGRDTDGHQVRTSPETYILANDLDVGHNSFILPSELGDYTYSDDWLIGDISGNIRSENWSKIDGTSVCPVGYRLPTFFELEDELSGTFLQLPNAGYKNSFSGYIRREASAFYLWTSTPSHNGEAKFISNDTDFTDRSSFDGLSVRCIQD